MPSMITKSGGLIEVNLGRSGLRGKELYIHIDQSYNVKNGEGEATIVLNVQECKDTIAFLNEFIKHVEGTDYVFTAESVVKLISTPEIQKVLSELGYNKREIEEELDIDIKEKEDK